MPEAFRTGLIFEYGPPKAMERYTLYPAAVDAGCQESVTLWGWVVEPLPVVLSTVGEFAALLVKFSVPDAEPVAFAVNTALNETPVPAATVTGNEIPLMVNSELVELAPVIVTGVPLAASDMLNVLLEPTKTLPNPKLEGFALSCPAAVPEPESGMLKFGLEASDRTAMLPVLLDATTGEKTTLNV